MNGLRPVYAFQFGALILEPLTTWTQGDEIAEYGEEKVVRMPKRYIGDYVVPIIKANTIFGCLKDALKRYIAMRKPDEIREIYRHHALGALILKGGAPFIGIEPDPELRRLAYSIPLFTMWGLGIGSWLPQAKMRPTDAVPVHRWGEYSDLDKVYEVARERLEKVLDVRLPPPFPLPSEKCLVVVQTSRRKGLRDEYAMLEIDVSSVPRTIATARKEESRDLTRPILIVREVSATMAPLLSIFNLVQHSLFNAVEIGSLAAALETVRTFGPNQNAFNIYAYFEFKNVETGKIHVLALARRMHEARASEDFEEFKKAFDEWLTKTDLAALINRLVDLIAERVDRRKGRR